MARHDRIRPVAVDPGETALGAALDTADGPVLVLGPVRSAEALDALVRLVMAAALVMRVTCFMALAVTFPRACIAGIAGVGWLAPYPSEAETAAAGGRAGRGQSMGAWRGGLWRMLLVLAAGLAASAARADYHVVARVALGGEGGWDYLEPDPASRRLYLTHNGHVQVLDMDTLKLVGDVPDSPGMGGVALARELNRGFTANGAEDKVGVFELDTLKPLAKWKATGKRPNQIAYEPLTQRVFSFNSTGRNVTVFDARSGAVLATIEVDGRTEFFAVDGKGMIYDALEDKATVIAIDARAMKVVATYALAPAREPSGMAMDVKTRRLFVPTHSRALLVLDADSGKILASLPIGAGNDAAKFDPGPGLVFASNGDGTLSVVHEDGGDRYSLVQTVQTEPGARTMAVDPQTHRVFLPTADFGQVVTSASYFGPPPPPTPDKPNSRGAILPGSFRLLVLEP